MIQIQHWMDELAAKLVTQFGGRLIFAGLQGSYMRGEATEQSDIDVMVVLDRLEMNDLTIYKIIVAGMPEGERERERESRRIYLWKRRASRLTEVRTLSACKRNERMVRISPKNSSTGLKGRHLRQRKNCSGKYL